MKVELNDDRLPEGAALHVAELGTLINRSEVEFDDEALARFENANGFTVADAFKNDSRVKLSGAGASTYKRDDPPEEVPPAEREPEPLQTPAEAAEVVAEEKDKKKGGES